MTSDEAERKMQFLFALRSRGVTDKRVLNAMEKIDRGAFVTGLFAERAYEDMPLPIPCGQTISQPSVVGLMTQALDVQPRDKILEVGTGSGYQAAILSQLGRRVYTLERHRRLVQGAEAAFAALRLTNITTILADGSHGYPEQAPVRPDTWSAPPPRIHPVRSWLSCAQAVSWSCRSGSRTPYSI